MILHINDAMTLEEVQSQFGEYFPFLRLCFYSRPHNKYESSDKKCMYGDKTLIADIRKNHVNGTLDIEGEDTVEAVEQALKETFDLNVQIFRYDALGCWIQTSVSDVLTLQQLSQMAADALMISNGN